MYIKKEDFGYLETLYKSLDEVVKKAFLDILLKQQAGNQERIFLRFR